MRAKKKYYQRAKDLYIHEGWDETQIASLFNISVASVKRWAKEGGWENDRVTVETSPWQMAFRIKEEIWREIKQKQLSGEGLLKSADSLSKLMAIAKKLDDRADLIGHTLIVLRDMAEWLHQHYPEVAKAFAPVFPLITDYLWVKYSR